MGTRGEREFAKHIAKQVVEQMALSTQVLENNGEPGWDRTNDHLIKSQMLYR